MSTAPIPRYFDYPRVASEAGISDFDLAAIEAAIRVDFPSQFDDMLFELRMLRTCRAIAHGSATVQDALRDFPTPRRDVA